MGNKLDIAKSLEAKDGFECHGLKYPPSYSVGSDSDTRKRANKKSTGESRRVQHRRSPAGPDDWLHCDYSVDNIVLSGGGSKGYAFVGALKVKNKFRNNNNDRINACIGHIGRPSYWNVQWKFIKQIIPNNLRGVCHCQIWLSTAPVPLSCILYFKIKIHFDKKKLGCMLDT